MGGARAGPDHLRPRRSVPRTWNGLELPRLAPRQHPRATHHGLVWPPPPGIHSNRIWEVHRVYLVCELSTALGLLIRSSPLQAAPLGRQGWFDGGQVVNRLCKPVLDPILGLGPSQGDFSTLSDLPSIYPKSADHANSVWKHDRVSHRKLCAMRTRRCVVLPVPLLATSAPSTRADFRLTVAGLRTFGIAAMALGWSI